eukprot:scaffold7552_cov112-Isochrysis_galbana.AAC.1
MSLGYISEARHYMRDPRSQVLAAYLDNDQDGCADDPNMLTSGLHLGLKLPGSGTRTQVVNGLALLPKLQIAEHANRSRAASRLYAGLQELFADEMRPECSGERGVRPSPSAEDEECFDASLEEVLHLVTTAGLAEAYPATWGEAGGSAVAELMDASRGGRFSRTPARYPPSAVFCFSDRGCDYACQVSEFVYWVATTARGAQVHADNWVPRRRGAVCTAVGGDGCDACTEWKPKTREQLDAAVPGWNRLFEGETRATTLQFFSRAGIIPDGTYAPAVRTTACPAIGGVAGVHLHAKPPLLSAEWEDGPDDARSCR